MHVLKLCVVYHGLNGLILLNDSGSQRTSAVSYIISAVLQLFSLFKLSPTDKLGYTQITVK